MALNGTAPLSVDDIEAFADWDVSATVRTLAYLLGVGESHFRRKYAARLKERRAILVDAMTPYIGQTVDLMGLVPEEGV